MKTLIFIFWDKKNHKFEIYIHREKFKGLEECNDKYNINIEFTLNSYKRNIPYITRNEKIWSSIMKSHLNFLIS